MLIIVFYLPNFTLSFIPIIMKTTRYSFFLILLFSVTIAFAGNNNADLEHQTRQWLDKNNESGFLENRGQMRDNEGNAVPQILFKAEAPNLNIWVTKNGLVMQTLTLRKEPLTEKELEEWEAQGGENSGRKKTKKFFDWERIDIELKGADIQKENIFTEYANLTNFNYFYPNNPDGIYGVKEHEKITIKEVYPGIDWVLYRNKDKGFKYDFVVHSGADYQQIELLYKSKTPIKINEQGQVELYTLYGNIKENTPVSFYQGKELKTTFNIREQKKISISGDSGYETSIFFQFISDFGLPTSDLIIDPQTFWASFYGGNGSDGPLSIHTDNSGNVFVAGYNGSANFPVQNAGTFFQGTMAGGSDAFILKFNNAGVRLWATYYGGSVNGTTSGYNFSYFNSITTDGSGNVFITGYTGADDFPVQNTGTFFQGTNSGSSDAVILKFNNSGTRLWATYYGGTNGEIGLSIAVDNSGNVFVTGNSNSTDFPIQTAGTFFQGATGGLNDIFILKFDNAGNRLWATYYGGSSHDYGKSLSIDGSNNVFVTGYTSSSSATFPVLNAGTYFDGTAGGTDVFILKFNNAGTRLWATRYGGSGTELGCSSAIDGSGNLFIMGVSQSTSTPVLNAGTFFQGTSGGAYDAFIVKFNNSGTRLWATYFGGVGTEYINSFDNMTIDNCGNVYVSFETDAGSFPHLINSCDAGYYDNTFNGGANDIVLSMFSNTGNLLWCTYVGGDGDDFREILTVDADNSLFMSGEWTLVTGSATYPLTNPGGGTHYDPTSNGLDDVAMLKFCSNACICAPFSGCTPVPLPIELLSFSGNCENNAAKLYWQTASEINNDFFTIERSADAVNFEPIGTKRGAGNSNTIQSYNYIDAILNLKPQTSNTLYYRLKQTDFDGNYEYFNIITVENNCIDSPNQLNIFPNPADNELNFQVSNQDEEEINIEVYDVTGKLIISKSSAISESNSLSVDISSLVNGMYMLNVKTKTTSVIQKFIKHKTIK